ncbi:MAG: ion transporter [Treponema sp.]|nr:ion transporter [Treponema sp.]
MIRQRIYEIIDNDPKDRDKASSLFDWIMMVLIWLNVAVVIIGSVNEIHDKYRVFFTYFELFSIAIFTIDYLLRLWTAPCKFTASKYVFVPYIRYIFSFLGVIDLLAILPFYLPFFMSIDLRILRILRIFRLLRVLKLSRYNNSFRLIVNVLQRQKEKLYITIFFMIIMILLASSVMYFIENPVQPDKFPNIPATLWWAVATLTTIGYGDIYPITILGKMLGGVIAIMGIGLIAMPSGIISMGLINEYEREKKRRKKKTATKRQEKTN